MYAILSDRFPQTTALRLATPPWVFLGYELRSVGQLWLCTLHDMPEFAAYFENSFGCNVFLWLNVIYISLSFVLFVLISLSFSMFCFRILKSTQVPQSFLFASALPPPLRSSLLSLSSLASLSLWLALSLASFSLCLSLHTQTTATAAAALLARLIPFASQFLQLRFVPTFAANRKIRKHITTNALCEQFFQLFLHFFTMFSPCCALACVFVFLSAAPFASFGPLPLASVRPQIAQST